MRQLPDRGRVRIISDLLTTLMGSEPESATSISTLMRRCNVSHLRLQRLLQELTSAGMIRTVAGEGGSRYILTAKGREFLDEYKEFEKFAESFGLRL
jgi:predicted transcriptional regulator